MSRPADRPLRVFLTCTGLGRTHRGYETFTQQCFDAVAAEPSIEATLFKGGGGATSGTVVLRSISRETQVARLVTAVARHRGPYYLEQLTFFVSLLPHIIRRQPHVILVSDWSLGNFLNHLRRRRDLGYRLLLSNGSPCRPPFPQFDHVQQLAPPMQRAALEAGEPPAKHTLLPYGFSISGKLDPPSREDRAALRRRLGLPEYRPIVISVGSPSAPHKRVAQLVQEVSRLAEPRPLLLLLGAAERGGDQVLTLARRVLGHHGVLMRTLDPSAVHLHYLAANCFALASLSEGFGRVFVEAMAAGLPCAGHDYETNRYLLGEHGHLADLRVPGALAGALEHALRASGDSAAEARHRFVRDRFSWEVLLKDYVALFHRVAAQHHCVRPEEPTAAHA